MAGHRDVALLGDKDKGRKGHPSGKHIDRGIEGWN